MLNKVYTYGFILDIHAPLTSTQTGSAALRLNCGLFLEKSLRRTCTGGTVSLWSKPPRTSEFDRRQANMVVCGMVGVVEGNRFAENAREWSPRGAKIKTVFNFRSTGIFGARHGRTFFGPAFFMFRPHQSTILEIPYILIPYSGGVFGDHYCDFVPRVFFLTNHRTFQTWVMEIWGPGVLRGKFGLVKVSRPARRGGGLMQTIYCKFE